MTLSATRLELFYSCPYSYFCRYGLRLRIPAQGGVLPPRVRHIGARGA